MQEPSILTIVFGLAFWIAILLLVRRSIANRGKQKLNAKKQAQELSIRNGQKPDFERQTHRVTSGRTKNEMVVVAIFRAQKIIRLILNFNNYYGKGPWCVDYQFDEVVAVERERLMEGARAGALEVTTIITTHDSVPTISFWDPNGDTYNNIRSAIKR